MDYVKSADNPTITKYLITHNFHSQLTSNHRTGKMFFRDQCKYTTVSNRIMKLQNHSAHGDRKYTCYICGYQKSRKIDLTIHYEAMHQGKKYQCRECDYKTASKGSLVDTIMRYIMALNTNVVNVTIS